MAARVWTTYDNTWLYVAFEVRHPSPDRIVPTQFDHDGIISADDDVEVFIDPGNRGRLYLHYMLSVGNTRAERRITVTPQGIQRDVAWDVPWRSATKRTPQGWNAEMAIPLVAAAGPDGKPVPGAQVIVRCEQGIPETVLYGRQATDAGGLTPGRGGANALLLTQATWKASDTPNQPEFREYSYTVEVEARGYEKASVTGIRPTESRRVVPVTLKRAD